MSLEALFLRRIEAEPNNSLHRQIYADWLEEQGDPRGELLRIQEQLRTLDVPDRPQVEARMHELIAQSVSPLTFTRTNSLGMKLVLIFPGEFLMGSPVNEPRRQHDEDQVAVKLTKAFWLGQFPVTQREYEQLTGNTPGSFRPDPPESNSRDCPVDMVSWEDASGFCRRLTELEQQEEGWPAGWSYALPSEAQWEYACRAGTTTATAFGDSLSSTQANFDGNYPYNGGVKGELKFRLTPAGSYPANAWSLYDMHGNVCEWCRDSYDRNLPGGVDPLRSEASGITARVNRGGNRGDYGRSCRSAYRIRNLQNRSFWNTGFRLALVPTP